jgi:iron(III) transport system substrate-binding protein
MNAITKLDAVLIVLVLVLAGVSAYSLATRGSTTSPTTSSTTAANPNPMEALVAEGQAEGGQLVLYSTWDSATATIMGDAFQKVYPWAHPSFVLLGDTDERTRVIAEYKTGHVGADAFRTSLGISHLITFQAAQNFSSYEAPLTNYTEQWCKSGLCYESDLVMAGVEVNTNMVQPSQYPRNISDLVNPMWKGKITFDDPGSLSGSGIYFADYYYLMGQSSGNNQTWTNLMKAFEAQNPQPAGVGDCTTYVSTGQDAICVGGHYDDYLALKQKGAPIAWIWWNPLPMYFPDVWSMDKLAAHPAMAQLWINWILSPSGQEALASGGSADLPIEQPFFSNSAGLPQNITLDFTDTNRLLNTTVAQSFINVYLSIFGNLSSY